MFFKQQQYFIRYVDNKILIFFLTSYSLTKHLCQILIYFCPVLPQACSLCQNLGDTFQEVFLCPCSKVRSSNIGRIFYKPYWLRYSHRTICYQGTNQVFFLHYLSINTFRILQNRNNSMALCKEICIFYAINI